MGYYLQTLETDSTKIALLTQIINYTVPTATDDNGWTK